MELDALPPHPDRVNPDDWDDELLEVVSKAAKTAHDRGWMAGGIGGRHLAAYILTALSATTRT